VVLGCLGALLSFKLKTTNALSLFFVFWGLGPSLEGPWGCLRRVLGAMFEDVGSKPMIFV